MTARVSLGTGGVESIEREIELSGPIHSKGVLTLVGYLTETYAQRWPLALRATIGFEQSYEGVDDDSASSTELYALLSALAELPVRQDVAVTGAVDQHGRVQAVGVDEGIELLTGRPAGARGADGVFPEGSVRRRVEDRLRGYADLLREFGPSPDGGPPAARATPSGG